MFSALSPVFLFSLFQVVGDERSWEGKKGRAREEMREDAGEEGRERACKNFFNDPLSSVSCLTCAKTLTRIYGTFDKLVSKSNDGISVPSA